MATDTATDEVQPERRNTSNTSPADANVHQSPGEDAGGRQELIDAIKEGRFDSLLKHWGDTGKIDEVTEKFAERFGLDEYKDLFWKVGRILRGPAQWRSRIGNQLLPSERTAMEHEFSNFSRQPKGLKVGTFMFRIGALVQGWSQITGNGANIEWPVELGLESFRRCQTVEGAPLEDDEVLIFAVVNAATYFAASFIGCWLADPLSDLFLGRRAPVFMSAVIILAASIGSACCDTWQQLLACRVLLGIGMGCKAAVLPVYAQEIAPSHLRGSIVVNWQIFVALGICLGFAANLIASSIRPVIGAWQWQNAALCIPTVVLLVLVYVSPESPRFQMRSKSSLWGGSLRPIWSGERYGLKRWMNNMRHEAFRLARAAVCLNPYPEADESASNPFLTDGRDPQQPEARHAPNQPRSVSETGTPGDRQKTHSQESSDPNGPGSNVREQQIASIENNREAAHYSTALKTLILLRGSPILAAKELLYTHLLMIAEQHHIPSTRAVDFPGRLADPSVKSLESLPLDDILFSVYREPIPYFRKLTHLWTIPPLRRATVSALVCMLSQQFCGVNVLIFYCSTLYAHNSRDFCGPTARDRQLALLLSFGIGLVNFVFAIPAYWLIHRGRRSLMSSTLPFMTVFMLCACLVYPKPDALTGHRTNLAIFTFLFMVVYSIGLGPVPFTLSSEVFPLEYRMVGMSFAVFANLLGAGVLALIVPPIYSSRWGNQGLLGIITLLNGLAFVFIILFVRETAGAVNPGGARNQQPVSLEELSNIFRQPTKQYLKAERWRLLPWMLRYPLQKLQQSIKSDKSREVERAGQGTEMEGMTSSTDAIDTANGHARG